MLQTLPLALLASLAVAAPPADDAYAKRHPNIAEALHLSSQASEKLAAAQQAKEFDPDGHARAAQEHLDKAISELKSLPELEKRHK